MHSAELKFKNSQSIILLDNEPNFWLSPKGKASFKAAA
jgi:hypothetical protein